MSTREAIERIPWLAALDDNERNSLEASSRVRQLKRGEIVVPHTKVPQSYNFVVAGLVKLSVRHENGRETILRLYPPGDWLDNGANFLGRPEHGEYYAMQDGTEVLLVDRARLRELVEQNRTAARAMMTEMARGYVEMRERVEDLAATPVPRRIARLLMRLADRFGVERNGRVLVPLSLSRQDLADLCGTTIETTIRVMSRLQGSGIVRKVREGFSIEEPKTLAKIGTGQTELRVR